jgi:hypothetical protein
MKDYKLKLRDLRASHTLGVVEQDQKGFFFCVGFKKKKH